MSELKPCQMTTERAIEQVTRCYSACGVMNSENKEFVDFVIAALRRAQPDNAPLTLEELRGMEGEPAWMARAKEWVFVSTVALEPYAQVWYFTSKGFAKTVLYHHERFYRRKPEPEGDEG